MEGSVDEDSTKSDEEYEDLAMRDGQENGYWTDDEEELAKEKRLTFDKGAAQNDDSKARAECTEKYRQNLDLFLKLSERFGEDSCTYALAHEKKERSVDARVRTRSLSDYSRLHSQLQSILNSGETGTIFRGPLVSAASLW